MKRVVAVVILLALGAFCSPVRGEEQRDYTVVKGDTLWDLSGEFYGDPFLWPLLWQQNQHITNPHVIFPGDKVRLYWGAPEAGVAEEERPAPVVPKRPVVKLYSFPEVLFAGFVDPNPPQGVGTVVGGQDDKEHMLQGDVVYISFRKGVEPVRGEEFTLFRLEGEVKHPRRGGLVGQKVSVVGRVEILGKEGEVHRGRVLLCYDGVRRGDRLLPYLPPLGELPLLRGERSLETWLVSSRREGSLLGEGDIVYLDRGEGDGLKPGLLLRVVRSKGEALAFEGDVLSLPEEAVARLVVISTRKGTATALILSSREPVHVGDRAEVIPR